MARRNLYSNAEKRMADFMEKQKKGMERHMKVMEYQKYVKKAMADKLEHRGEFIKTADEHNVVWARQNIQKIDRTSKASMRDIRMRQIKSQETDRNMSITHNETFSKGTAKNFHLKQTQINTDNLNIESKLK